MKKMLLLLLIIAAIGILNVVGAFTMGGTIAMDQNSTISIEVNNRKINLKKPAFISDEDVMVPIKDVFKAMGATIEWRLGEEYEYPGVNMRMNEISLYFSIDQKNMGIVDKEGDYRFSANVRSISLDNPVRLIDGDVFMPISVIEHIRTVNMKWNENTRTISLTYDIISRLNGVWVDEVFIDSVSTGGIVKDGKPVMFSIFDARLEYILAQEPIISRSLKAYETAKGQIEISPFINSRVSNGYPDFDSKIVIDNSDEIQMIKYISKGIEHTLLRYSSYEMMVQKLSSTFNWSYYFYSDSITNDTFSIVRLLIKESFTYNEDMIEMRTYEGELKTFIFEYGPSFYDSLKLYGITDNNQKGELKHILSGNTVARPLDKLPQVWENPFSDVNMSNWFYDDVGYVVANSIFNGTSATTFEPNSPMTRAMFVTALWRLAGKPAASGSSQFSDVQEDAYYTKAVQWAEGSDIISGIGNGQFASDLKISRQDICVILARYMEYTGATYAVTDEYRLFADEDEIADYAKNAVQAMNKCGIIEGKGNNTIDPKGAVTRAEAAAILHRFMKLL